MFHIQSLMQNLYRDSYLCQWAFKQVASYGSCHTAWLQHCKISSLCLAWVSLCLAWSRQNLKYLANYIACQQDYYYMIIMIFKSMNLKKEQASISAMKSKDGCTE